MTFSKIFFATFTVFVLASCGGNIGTKTNNEGCYDTIYKPRYATHFVVLSSGDTTIVSVKNPWQGASGITYNYPFVGETPERIITMSSSHSAFFEALELGGNIVGVSGPQYISSKALQNLPDVGYDNNLHYETIVGLKPNILTTYELSGENSSSRQKLISLSIPVVYIADYLENSPLAKAEWLVAFGIFSGKLDQAIEIFEDVETNYNLTKTRIKEYLAQNNAKRPTVMLNSPYKDVWYLPGDNSYIVELINDAGGDYVAKGVKNNISRATSMEVAYTLLQKSDVWLNPAANINTKKDLAANNALLNNIKIAVYNNTARGGKDGGSDFWESGVIRPDIALNDIASILYPELFTEHNLYYYKEIK